LVSFLLFISFSGVNYQKLGPLVGSLSPILVVLVLVFDVSNILCYGTAWYYLVHTVHPTVRLRKCVQAVMISIFGDIVIPTASVTGEALRVSFANREFDLPYPEGIATVVVHRVLNIFASATVLALSGAVLLTEGNLGARFRFNIFVLLVLVLIPVVAGVTILVRPTIASGIVVLLTRRFARYSVTAQLVRRITGGLKDFERSITLIRNRARELPKAFLLLLAQVFSQILVPYAFLIVVSMNQNQTVNYWTMFWLVSLAFPIFGLVNLAPIGIPGMLGVLDTAMAGTFILLGFTPEVAIVTTLLTRGVSLLFELGLTGTVVLVSGYSRFVRRRNMTEPPTPIRETVPANL
jgi:uncharacterized protein (TIRG00374 family)